MAARIFWLLLIISTSNIALQAMLARSQLPGFVSIDCGSDSTTVYTDSNEIEWTGDSNLMREGRRVPVNGHSMLVLSNMRLFDGDQSKYCYHVTDDAIVEGAFFLVRGSFWAGITPPYKPRDLDDQFHFKLIVDADVWTDVSIPYGDTHWYDYEMYMRAQRSSIDVCLARSTPDGDAPFISALELRPLPSTLTSTQFMHNKSRIFMLLGRSNYGLLSTQDTSIRYPLDPLDRKWYPTTTTSPYIISTESDVSTNQADKPPLKVLKTARTNEYITWINSNLDPTMLYFAEFYFAEIDQRVNTSGQRVFNVYSNGELANSSGPVDVFAKVGPNAAYSSWAVASPDAYKRTTFNLSSTPTSIFPPFLAAGELFSTQIFNPITDSTTVSAVDNIKATLNLSASTGDPCFPIGFGYKWLNCSLNRTLLAISLSNYKVGGEIPVSLNTLTTLTHIYLDGNRLQGEIPDLSALLALEVLVLSNNELIGAIPDFFTTLKGLEVLNLENNKLSGLVPLALLQRKQASTLNLQLSGNPLCESDSDAHCKTSSQQSSQQSSKKRNVGIIIATVIAVVVVVGIGIWIAVCCFCKKRNPLPVDQQPINLLTSSGPVLSKSDISKLSIQYFSFEEIKIATNNFSAQLGMGGFGPVYEGRLQDGHLVAIKVASKASRQGPKEFRNEVDLLSRVHHKNLVQLLGYCIEEKLVLVYEFMSKGSLFDCLHGASAMASPLPWRTRLRILVDAAQGFDYLHHGCNPRIIHRDVKSSNILLSDQLEAKISDFGISRNSFINATGAPSTALMGSMGYMDPEYLSTMKLTEKVDVYSFGVLIFEVVCGKTALFAHPTTHEQVHIAEWAKSSIDRGVIEGIVDPLLNGEYNESSIWKVVKTALACVTFKSSRRPKMSTVFHDLKEAECMEHISEESHVFDKPSIDFGDGRNEHDTSFYKYVNA